MAGTKKARDAKPKGAAKKKPPAKTRGPTRRAARKGSSTAKRADAAAEAAKKAGAVGKKVTTQQRMLRDSMIRARAAAGWTNAMIAQEAGLGTRAVERVLASRSFRSPLDETPMALLENIARGFQQAIADFEAMAWAHGERNPNVALGAKKAAGQERERLVQLLQLVGKLPSNLELFRSEMQMRQIGEQMVEMMRGLSEGTKTIEEVESFFRELIEARRAMPELEPGS